MKFRIQKSMLNYTAIIIQAHSISEMSNHHRQPKDFNSKKCLQTNLSHWTLAPRSETFNRFVCQTRKSFAEKKTHHEITLTIRLVRSSLTTSRNLLRSHILILRVFRMQKKLFLCANRSSRCWNTRMNIRFSDGKDKSEQESPCAEEFRKATAQSWSTHVRKFLSKFKSVFLFASLYFSFCLINGRRDQRRARILQTTASSTLSNELITFCCSRQREMEQKVI